MSEIIHHGIGGAGRIFACFDAPGFVTKVLKLYNEDGKRNNLFWEEAKSVQAYCAIFRHFAGGTKIPIAMQFLHQPKEGHCRKDWRNPGCLSEIKKYLNGYVFLPPECNTPEKAEEASDNLAIFYPLRAMKMSLKEKLDQKASFSGDDAVRFLYQMISAFIFLYHNGCAHSDIKPANIMLDENNDFVLTDFGSLTNASCNNGSGTEAIAPPKQLIIEWQKKYDNAVTLRSAMDCYALAHTLYCMAKGDSAITRAPNRREFQRWDEKGQALETIFTKLRYNIPNDFSITHLSDILAMPLFSEYASKHREFKPYNPRCDIDFEVWWKTGWNGGDIGTFHTQINLVGKADPLVRIAPRLKPIKREKDFLAENTSYILGALAITSQHCFLHAPDNAKTGGRVQSKEEPYTPKTLVSQNGAISESEKARFMSISELLIQNKMDNILLSGEDVIWIDGALTVSPLTGIRIPFRVPKQYALTLQGSEQLALLGKLKEALRDTDIDCVLMRSEPDFRSISPDRLLKAKIIKFLLGHFEQYRHIVPESTIREEICKDPDLFLEDFKNGLPFELEREEWGCILKLTRKCNSFCPEAILADFFRDSKNRWSERHPAIGKFRAGGELSSEEWSELICQEPQKYDKMPESQLRELGKKAWIRLLGIHPELIDQCPHIAIFSETQWCSILLLQPQLQTHCPQKQWSEKSQRRLKKQLDL